MRSVHSTLLRLFVVVTTITATIAFGSTKTSTKKTEPKMVLTQTVDVKSTSTCENSAKKSSNKTKSAPKKVAKHTTSPAPRPVQRNLGVVGPKMTAPVVTAQKSKKVEPVAKKAEKKKTTRMSLMTYDELKEEKQKLIAKGNNEIAIKFIEKMVPLCSDLGELSDLMLELADLLFDAGNLEKAERLYSEFASMYPGHKKAEYASYKAIICSYWETLDHQRDQSKTKATIERAEAFIKQKATFVTYGDQVDEILYACREKLLESEMSIFHYYLQREDYVAAQTRLNNIEKEILPNLPAKEPVIISLACELATKQNNLTVLEEKKTILTQRFPDFVADAPVAVASASTTKRAVDRF